MAVVALTVLQAVLVVGWYGAAWVRDPDLGGAFAVEVVLLIGLSVLALVGAALLWRGTGRTLLLVAAVLQVVVVVLSSVAGAVTTGSQPGQGAPAASLALGVVLLVCPLVSIALLAGRGVRSWAR